MVNAKAAFVSEDKSERLTAKAHWRFRGPSVLEAETNAAFYFGLERTKGAALTP